MLIGRRSWSFPLVSQGGYWQRADTSILAKNVYNGAKIGA